MSSDIQRYSIETEYKPTGNGYWVTYDAHMEAQERLNDRIEALERENADLRAAIKRQASAAINGMNAAKEISSHQLQAARELEARSNPAALNSEHDMNDKLTREIEALEQRLAAADRLLAHIRGEVEWESKLCADTTSVPRMTRLLVAIDAHRCTAARGKP